MGIVKLPRRTTQNRTGCQTIKLDQISYIQNDIINLMEKEYFSRRNLAVFLLAAAIVVIALLLFYRVSVHAETNISSVAEEQVAWEDVDGWWNFYQTNTVVVWGTRIEGYASSSAGEISLDCATTPTGNVCGDSNYGVCNGPGPHSTDGSCPSGDASGVLSGYGWNDTIGWISFNCNQTSHGGSNDCASSNYKVQIDSNGDFSGYAWNDVVGWISFNCANDASCGVSNYKVNTSWRATSSVGYLTSVIFDTQKTAGAVLNSIIWQGDDPDPGGGTCVNFQIATSSSQSGPWNYVGPSGDSLTYYAASCATAPNGGVGSGCAAADTPVCVNKSAMIARYLRYKVQLRSNLLRTETPRVDDVILNWSP